MTSKKPERSVSSMNVLNDIRGLLSTTKEPSSRPESKTAPKADTTALEEEVKRFKALVEKQQDELDKVKSENKTLAQKHFDEITKLKNENKTLFQKHVEEINKLKSESKAPVAKQPETDKIKNENKAQTQKLQDEVDRLKSENKILLQKQAEIDKLKNDVKELTTKLEAAAKAKPVSSGTAKPDIEIQRMEASKEELSLALTQVEGLLQLRSKELMNRLARVYQEAAQGEIALEFRRGRDQLESLENLAHFVQALLNE